MLPHDHLLTLSENHKSGLILLKPHYGEFLGPGAIVGNQVVESYEKLIVIGSLELLPVTSYQTRQQGYQKRIQWMRWQQRMTEHPEATVRVEKLLTGFEAFFGSEVIASLPDYALASLIGVLPQTVDKIRTQHYALSRMNRRRKSDSNRPSGGWPVTYRILEQLDDWNPIATDLLSSKNLMFA